MKQLALLLVALGVVLGYTKPASATLVTNVPPPQYYYLSNVRLHHSIISNLQGSYQYLFIDSAGVNHFLYMPLAEQNYMMTEFAHGPRGLSYDVYIYCTALPQSYGSARYYPIRNDNAGCKVVSISIRP